MCAHGSFKGGHSTKNSYVELTLFNNCHLLNLHKISGYNTNKVGS